MSEYIAMKTLYSYRKASQEHMTTERSKNNSYKAYIHDLKMGIRINIMN